MAETAGNWCLIESDPGVFTELIREFGVKGVQVEELWSLEPEQFENLKPIHGLIFLFKWTKDDEPNGTIVQDSRLDKIFFAKQVIENACATQAILSVLLNCRHADLKLGHTLSELKDFCQGLCIIHLLDNKFSNLTPLWLIKMRMYFILLVTYQLMVDCPVAPDSDWVDVVRPIIEKRIQRYNEGEIHFNLMAIVSDRKMLYQRQLESLQKYVEEGGMETDAQQTELARLRLLIEEEDNKRHQYQIENIRRKHNYLPLIVEILKILAKEGKLMPLYEQAKQKSVKKQKSKMSS
ncbi:hypothetical protein MTP99_013177 [Tenebrio molitor]|nr:hypothetical protein MTP99_013177 [Tenebrio molitor]